MGLKYFKSRKRFDFSPYPFDVGNIFGLKTGYGDNHFLLKIYGLDKAEFEAYYTHHLNHFISTGKGTEKDFLAHVWQIVQKRIEYFERKDRSHPGIHGICQTSGNLPNSSNTSAHAINGTSSLTTCC